jgi:hypothetical protein
MANPYDTLSPEDYAQQQQLNRQQKMAEMLMSQNQQPQGQMVSGRYVAPSFFQNLAPLVNTYVGKGMLEQGDTKQRELAELIRGRNSQDLEKFIDLSQGSKDFKPAVPYPTKPVISEGSDLGPQSYPPIENQVGQAPNKQAAALLALRSYDPTLRQLGGSMLSQMTKEPELVNVAPGGSLVRNVNGKVENVFTAPEKLSPTEMQRNYALATQQGYRGSFMDYQKEVTNMKEQRVRISVGGGDNGMPNMGGQGGFDKKGNFVAPTGAIFTPVEIRKDREEVGSLINALQSINKISKEDVAASDTILGNVSEGGFKGYVAKQAGLDQVIAAQNKINAAGVMQILNNLPPGPASDKDIAMAKSSFPGYGNAKALQSWINNTNATLTQKVGNYEQKYGNMNWYGNVNPLQPNTQSGGDFKIKEKGK